jgi:predicted O-methyltransferase YrrM
MSKTKPPAFYPTDASLSDASLSQLRAHQRAAEAAFPGPDYLAWLRWLHDRLRPRFYCEIGVEYGSSLALARPETVAIGIDPAPLVAGPLPLRTKVFALSSDDFFLKGSVQQVLGEDRFDFAFVDGLHRAGQALHDFIHLERFSRPGAVIAIHDVLPLCAEVATPEQQTVFWTGDTFKALLVLTELRPQLRVTAIPCFPSGLGIVTGLDPQDATSPSAYAAAAATWEAVKFDAALAALKRSVTILPNKFSAFASRARKRGTRGE